ncbi:putative secreted protein (Por secretion system target) [Lutibacter sp. Hel_I_33_5]|uniref:T9SS type A sorting domain-containing protein n=1 Tax=Lutibacter sp. Hel_I_33_5 TaxID=1566289 RepID=UPI0011AC27C0|nr:T9SS type A sorting domain-containing protein [Lutibacter sp. Hel_I_33_5]TVZ56284.1 putative secreted protein (Por secretion system target) [Lutibacter sp. Hel_I_33_5]
MKKTLLILILFITSLGFSQTFELFDFNQFGDFQPKYFTEYNGMLIFQAKDDDGVELWKSDGTQSGTVKIKDINPNSSDSSDPRSFIEYNGKLYFIANEGGNNGLWVTDGSESGTVLVKDAVTPTGSFAVANNLLFFVGENPTNGKELWKSDGTTSGTTLVKDIYPDSWSSLQFNSQLMPFENSIVFRANDGAGGSELWKSDGTDSGTKMIKDIYVGAPGSSPQYFIEYASKIYFSAETLSKGTELWKTDGTESGTVMIKDIYEEDKSSHPAKFFVYSESLFFQAQSDDEHGIEMHKYNLTTNSVTRELDLKPGAEGGGFSPAIVYNDGMYFTAAKPETGIELFVRRNGSTTLAEDVYSGSIGGSPSAFCNCGDNMYFRAYNGKHGLFEFKTTGNATPIAPQEAVNDAFFGSIPSQFFCYKNSLYFAANYTGSGYDMWKYTPLTLSVNKFDIEKVSVYPNPTDTTINISLQNNSSIKKVEIFNLMGQKSLSKKIDNQSIINLDVSNFSKGIYLLKIQGEGREYLKKFVKK